MTLAARRRNPDDVRLAIALGIMRARHRPAVAPRPPYPWQVPPPQPWNIWLLLGGRGTGKTDAGAAYVNAHADGPPCLEGRVPHRMAIVAPSHDDAVDTCVRGESGILSINRRIGFHPGASLYADLTWPNGAEAMLFGTFGPEDVERFRGPQHCLVWGDEFAAWRKLDEAWTMIDHGLRLGPHPHVILTTTPKRRALLVRIMGEAGTITTTGRTADAHGLPAERRDALYARYGGSAIGRQELDAEIIDDVAGALWQRGLIESSRVPPGLEYERIVVAIDPSATSTESADEAGIVVVGLRMGHGYVLDDVSLRGSPAAWARVAVDAYHRWHADRIIAETNNGGDMVEFVLRSVDPRVPYESVTASRGKQTRAEPISALYEAGLVHHVGTFPTLEDQMCSWTPSDRSPDRMDALVWGLSHLLTAADDPWARLAGQRVGGVG